jgi:hypothetical protein
MNFKTPVLVIAMLGLGAAVGWQLRGANTTTQSGRVAEPRSIAASTVGSARERSSIDTDVLRQVVREELSAARAADGRAAPAASPKPVTQELVAQRRAAVDEIETLIRSGEWGNEQRATFHQQMTVLDPEQAARLLREVTIAFNQGTMRVTKGTMRVTTDGPPL